MHKTFIHNPQYAIQVKSKSKVVIMLSQFDSRLTIGKMKYDVAIGIAVAKVQTVKRLDVLNFKKLVQEHPNYSHKRDITISFDADENSVYIVIPATQDPLQEIKYSMLIYANSFYNISHL